MAVTSTVMGAMPEANRARSGEDLAAAGGAGRAEMAAMPQRDR